MTIEQRKISFEQSRELLGKDESHFLDFKSRNIAPRKISKTMSAFANSDGGDIYVGVEDDHSWGGFSTPESANGLLQCFDDVFPLGQYIDYEFIAAENQSGLVLHVSIQKSSQIHYATDKKAYLRLGAQNRPVQDPKALKRLEFAKGLTSFESTPVDWDTSELDLSETMMNFMITVIPNTEPLPWLKKQRMLIDGKPTVAAILLFSDEPQAALPKRSGIKIYRYSDKSEHGSRATLAFDPITIEGSLYSQISCAVKKTIEIVQESKILSTAGLEMVRYPKETPLLKRPNRCSQLV